MTQASGGELAQRESGLLVPSHLATVPEGGGPDTVARDPDGRRRVVLTREARRRFGACATDLGQADLAFVLVCRTTHAVRKTATDAATGEKVPVVIQEPIAGACGEVMVREGEETHDPGFGCACTRVHFTAYLG